MALQNYNTINWKQIVSDISKAKDEPDWMFSFRLDAINKFLKKGLPSWGPNLSDINFQSFTYYTAPKAELAQKWQDVPDDIRKKYEKLGIPEHERKFFAGVGAQYDSQAVYHNIRKKVQETGVVFVDTDTALRKYPKIFKEYFGKIVPPGDNTFAALNSALWSGGSFVYVPKNVKVTIPLQAFFMISKRAVGQFERTLIVADEGSQVHYIEGCTAPVYSKASLHAAVVEIFAKPRSHVRYTTVQNWSDNVYNLVTKRARVEEGAFLEWVDGNIGSKITMKYPSAYLYGRGARADILSVAMAGEGQIQDTGAKMLHLAPETSSNIVSKTVSFKGGISNYRGLVKVVPGATNARSSVKCDALIMDENSQSNTFPTMDIKERDVRVEHEAHVSRLSEKELFYLQSRGFSQADAAGLLVSGFMEPFAKELPDDYAMELNRLIQMEMEGAEG